MNILLLGGSGFIGARLARILRVQGHCVTTPKSREINYLNLNIHALQAACQGQDVLINAVGVMHYQKDVLEMVHHFSPQKIAEIGKQAGIKQMLQLSALGANAEQSIAFVGSKGRGDKALLALADESFQVQIARPSIVFGRGGASSEAFLQAAKLPLLMLPEKGEQRVQPVHVDDVVQAMAQMVATPLSNGSIVEMGGAEVLTLAQYLSTLRQCIHGKKALTVWRVPSFLVKMATFILEKPTTGLVSADNLALLKQGSVAKTEVFIQLLGRNPQVPNLFTF